MQRGGLRAAGWTYPVAAWACDVHRFGERRAQSLPRQLEQAEPRDLAQLHARPVVAQRVLHPHFDLALVAGALHVDEVDDDQSAEVAQPELPGDFVGGLQVRVERGRLDVARLGRARRVDVDRDQGFRMVDHDGPARRQCYLTRVGGLDLVLDLEPREKRDVVLVELHAVDVGRHHVRHELLRLVVDRLGVDQELADVGVEVVADRADDEARLLVDQVRARLHLRRVLDRVPELHQVVQVPLQLLGAAADARGAGDDAHARRNVEARDGIAQVVPLLALDAPRDAAAAWVVRHQHEIAAGERDVGRERGALVAALVLVDLDDHLHALAELILHAAAATAIGLAVFAVTPTSALDVLARDLLERQEAVALGAVVDEARLEARLDAGDDGLVDVALALLLARGLDVEVDQPLAVDDRHAEFLRLRGIEQHALHVVVPARVRPGLRRRKQSRAARGGDAIARRTRAGTAAPAATAASFRERKGSAGLSAWRRFRSCRGFAFACRVSWSRSSVRCRTRSRARRAAAGPVTEIVAKCAAQCAASNRPQAGCGDCALHLPSLLSRGATPVR